MSTPVEQIKERLNIVDVISGYLKLEKAGINFKARCPFHNEKTPSFFVSPTRQSYHCFGCSQSGDLISFVQEMESLNFPDTLQLLAERAGIKFQKVNRQEDNEKESLSRVLSEATDYFIAELAKNNSAIEYLRKRGLTNETIKSFRLGFAPAKWQNVSQWLLERGFKENLLIQAGLIVKSKSSPSFPNGRYYDRFRNRIIFPLADQQGRIVAFSGRIFIFGESEIQEAKYINSPTTKLYDKSRILFGLDRAKIKMRQTNSCILVEGQMDLVLSHQAGFTNTVATSGTALTKEHLNTIKRLADKLIMAYDADSAGVLASVKGIELALASGLEVNIVKLPANTDPADIILKNPKQWSQEIINSKHVIDFYLAVLEDKYSDIRQLGRAIREEVYPYIRQLAFRIDQAHFIAKIANSLHLTEEAVWRDYDQALGSQSSKSSSVDKNMPEVSNQTRLEKVEENLFSLLLFLAEVNSSSSEFEFIIKELKDIYKKENNYDQKKKFYYSHRDKLLLQAEIFYANRDGQSLKKEAEDLLTELKLEILKKELLLTQTLLKKAEMSNSISSVDSLVKKCQNIAQAINKLKS